MGLDEVLNEFEQARTQLFVSREQKFSDMRQQSQHLRDYIGTSQARERLDTLDNIALSLKRRPDTEEIADVIKAVDHVRKPYRPQGEMTAYDIISTNSAQYVARIENIHQFLDDNVAVVYDDLALTKDWLETNSYVRRKRRNDTSFDNVAQTLVNRLDERMDTYDSTPETGSHGKKYRALDGASAMGFPSRDTPVSTSPVNTAPSDHEKPHRAMQEPQPTQRFTCTDYELDVILEQQTLRTAEYVHKQARNRREQTIENIGYVATMALFVGTALMSFVPAENFPFLW